MICSYSLALIILFLVSCTQKDTKLKKAIWQVNLEVQDQKKLPFNFKTTDSGIEIYNTEEIITVDGFQKRV